MRSTTMALNQIWKQQLALVTYGNEFLKQDLSFSRWINHPIFEQHIFEFRDLNSQHLLAQHFHIWLTGLKKQGVQKLSLHNSTLLVDEQNPNANVELLAFPHFIVSHTANKKTAWILGKELPEWYGADEDYKAPASQTNPLRKETFWCYELNTKLSKRLEADFAAPKWDDIELYMQTELFKQPFAQNFQFDVLTSNPNHQPSSQDIIHSFEHPMMTSLLPYAQKDNYANIMLEKLESFSHFIEAKTKNPITEEGVELQPDDQLQLRNFAKHTDELFGKFITKAANHYPTAMLTPVILSENPLDDSQNDNILNFKTEQKSANEPKEQKSGAFTLICITIIICVIGYYFGL